MRVLKMKMHPVIGQETLIILLGENNPQGSLHPRLG